MSLEKKITSKNKQNNLKGADSLCLNYAHLSLYHLQINEKQILVSKNGHMHTWKHSCSKYCEIVVVCVTIFRH